MTGKDVLPEKKIWIFSVKQRNENQASVAEKRYQKLDNAFKSNKKEEDISKKKRSPAKSNLAYAKDFTFNRYPNTKEFAAKKFFRFKMKWIKRV